MLLLGECRHLNPKLNSPFDIASQYLHYLHNFLLECIELVTAFSSKYHLTVSPRLVKMVRVNARIQAKLPKQTGDDEIVHENSPRIAMKYFSLWSYHQICSWARDLCVH